MSTNKFKKIYEFSAINFDEMVGYIITETEAKNIDVTALKMAIMMNGEFIEIQQSTILSHETAGHVFVLMTYTNEDGKAENLAQLKNLTAPRTIN